MNCETKTENFVYILVYVHKNETGGAVLTDEKKLLRNIQKRKRGSLEKIIEIYTPYVSVVVYNTIGAAMAREDIEEVVSDVFMALWKRADELDAAKGCLRAYLGTAARNSALNKLRGFKTYEELDIMLASPSKGPEEIVNEAEERKILIGIINELGEPDAEIFFRYYWYEEKISKIAALTGLKVSTITTKLARGRKKLKQILESRGYCNE